jgi:hypothetical protein
VLADARINVKHPPRIYLDVAIEQFPGIVSFFEHDVPLAFKDAERPSAARRFSYGKCRQYRRSQKQEEFLKKRGGWQIFTRGLRSARPISQKLQYDEMVDIPRPPSRNRL